MKKKFSPRKRHVIVFLLILAVLAFACTIFIVKSWLKTLQDPQFVSAVISRAIECPVNVEKVSISPGGRLILTNVIIYTPDALKRRREMLTAPLIIASFSPWKIMRGKYEKSLTAAELGDPTLHLTPDTLQWLQKRLDKLMRLLPSTSIKSGTLELSGFPLISPRQFKKIRGTLKLRYPQWECDLKGTSSDLQEKWGLQGKGPVSGKPLMKLRGQNVEIADVFGDKALKDLPHFKGKADLQAEFLEPQVVKGNVKAGKLIASLFPADKKWSLTDALMGEWNEMSIAFSRKGEAPLELRGEALHTLLGKVFFQGRMGKGTWEMASSAERISYASLTFMEPELHLRKKGESLTGFISSKKGKADFQAELPEPEGVKGNVKAGKLIASLLRADRKGSLTDALKGGWKEMSITLSQKGGAPLEFRGKTLHTLLGKILFTGKMGKRSREMTFSLRQVSFATLTLMEPELRLKENGESLTGSLSSKTGKMEEFLLVAPHFAFEAHDGLAFTGNCIIFDSNATISGKCSAESMHYTVKIPSFNLKNLSTFKIREDNLSGVGYLKATIIQGNEKSLFFSLESENLYWAKKKLPRISLDGEQKKGILLISALSIFTGTSPILLEGAINIEKQTCALNGRIEEASLQALIDMAGGKAPDLQGRLSGGLDIMGELKKPEFHFEGRVLQLVYKGKDMGDGTLKVSGTSQAINGRLDLDRPPGLRAGIAPANVEMTYYVLIGGTVKDPVFKPQTTGPRLTVNPGGIWKFFQKLIP
ncbi:MAG: hypothetical protein RDV48_30010 [Candidatus Eremiobacteraeota bacterium]|nr:hypothetical protein [Candidatus Eremiobacteraeota bacterium]